MACSVLRKCEGVSRGVRGTEKCERHLSEIQEAHDQRLTPRIRRLLTFGNNLINCLVKPPPHLVVTIIVLQYLCELQIPSLYLSDLEMVTQNSTKQFIPLKKK